MSNAVPTLAAATAFVQPDPSEVLNSSSNSSLVIRSQHIKSSSASTSPSPSSNKLSATSSSSSNSEVNSTHTDNMTNNTSAANTADIVSSTPGQHGHANLIPTLKQNGKPNYYHAATQQQQIDMSQQHFLNHHPIPINLNHFSTQLNGTGLQYIQLNSNSNSTSMSNGSPLSSSLTSSPSTVNSSIQYLNHQPQPSHLAKSYAHHGNSTTTIYPQHQQFQQLQQFNSQFQPNYKDTRWLTLEVCREFQRNKCSRNETECKFAHPPSHVEIINGKVIACYDSLKGKCTRKEPPCKYLHPPQHLKDQLLQNGKNNLVLRQVALAMMQQQQQQQPNAQTNPDTTTAALLAAATATRSTPHQYATFAATSPSSTNSSSSSVSGHVPQFYPSLAGYQQVQLANGQPHLLQMIPSGYAGHQLGGHIYASDPGSTLLQQVSHNSTISPPVLTNANGILPPQQRTDRLQICKDYQKNSCGKPASECELAHPPPHCPVDQDNSLVTVCVDFIKGKCSRENCKYFHPPEHLVSHLKKLKLTNNALAAAAYAASNHNMALIGSQAQATHFSPIHQQPTYSFGLAANQFPLQHGATNSFSPYRLNNRSYDPTNSLQLAQFSDQFQLHRQPQFVSNSPHPFLTNRINAYNDIAYLRPASSHIDSSQMAKINNNNNVNTSYKTSTQFISPSAASLTSATSTAIASAAGRASGNSQIGDMNDTNGTIVTLENGQSYQLPQYQMYPQLLQRPKNNSSNEENISQLEINNANSASATTATIANTLVDNVPSKKRQHDAIDQDYNSMTSGNIYSASNIPVKRTALTDTKTGMPIFQPLGQSSLHHLTGTHQSGMALQQTHLHPSQSQVQQQIALSQQLGALSYQQVALNASQMQYAPYPTVMSLPYMQTGMPRL